MVWARLSISSLRERPTPGSPQSASMMRVRREVRERSYIVSGKPCSHASGWLGLHERQPAIRYSLPHCSTNALLLTEYTLTNCTSKTSSSYRSKSVVWCRR